MYDEAFASQQLAWMRSWIRVRITRCAITIALALSTSIAMAQEAVRTEEPEGESDPAPATQTPAQLEEIVVTGTLIRGLAPVGTQAINVDGEDIRRTGATSTNAVLATVPVVTNAFNTNASNLTDVGSTTFRPNIRGLGAAGGNTTLVLIDGHNVVGAGILQTTPDAGVIPPGMLERIEILADGGSSLYGSDAVGGIVNYITKRKHDGVQFDGAYGFTEEGYHTDSLNLTLGDSWDSGSYVLSVLTRSNSLLWAYERDFPRQNLSSQGGSDFRSTACPTPNFTVGDQTFRFEDAGFVEGVARCEANLFTSIVPEERQNAAYGSFSQTLTGWIDLEVTGFYSRRRTTAMLAQSVTTSLAIPQTNVFFTPVGDETSQSAAFSYAPALGNSRASRGELDTFGITPVLTFDFAGDWQLRAMYNYGWSDTTSETPGTAAGGVNPIEQAIAVAGTTAQTALNPYDIAATHPAVLARLTNWQTYGNNEQTLEDSRVIADGPLFDLPGGTVRLAVGGQYQDQTSRPLFHEGPATLRSLTPSRPRRRDTRTVRSTFTQIVVPVVSAMNAIPLVRALDIDVSVRHDDYSDFGHTTNPRFAFSWNPVDSLTLRGNVGRSFNAPSLADSRDPSQLQLAPAPLAVGPNFVAPDDFARSTVVLAGGNPGLQPQTARTWTAGFDWTPPRFDGLSTGMTYWSVEVDDLISVAPPGFASDPFNPAYAPFITENPTRDALEATFAAAAPVNPDAVNLDALYPPGPYLFLDLRRRNYGRIETSGVDFYLRYFFPVGWGLLFANVNGVYTLTRDNVLPDSPAIDLTDAGFSRLQASATLGATRDRISASVTANYSRGYDVLNAAPQTSVDSYVPVNMALAYDFRGTGTAADLSLTLNVNNVFDEYPPFLNTPGSGGTTNGQTIGRLFTFGVRKAF